MSLVVCSAAHNSTYRNCVLKHANSCDINFSCTLFVKQAAGSVRGHTNPA